MTCSDSLGFNDVCILDESVESLSKGIGLRFQRHGREEATALTRGRVGYGLGAATSSTRRRG
jgi:hypothetical protein